MGQTKEAKKVKRYIGGVMSLSKLFTNEVSNKSNKWIVQVFGNPNGTSWEISVVRESNEHGRNDYGWFDENKLLVSHNGGPCHWGLAPGLGDKMIQIANELADELNI
jgi:hypothetical protein